MSGDCGGFFQTDRRLFTSSIWLQGSPAERVLWIWLLGNKDDDGVVRHRELAIADGAKLPRDVVEAALTKFSEPDPDSRTRTNDGRRIARTDDGFVRILNHEAYYTKDYSTPRWRRWKERQDANALAALENVSSTKNKNKDKNKNTTTSTDTASGGGVPAELTLEPTSIGIPIDPPKKRRAGRPAPDATVQACASRFVKSFNAAFARRVTVLPDLARDVAERLADGYTAEQLVCLPILAAAVEMPDDLRRGMRPAWLLRNGSHPHTGPDGRVSGRKNWVQDLLSSADRTLLWPQHAAAAEAVGVLDELRRLGVRFAEAEQ